MISAKDMSRVKSVATISPTRSFRSSPTALDMRICPAFENPMATKVISCSTSPPMATADRPCVPTNRPTTIMSTML